MIKKYDKISHFVVGLIVGIIGIDYRLASTLFIGKQIYDCYKPKPTGFDLSDLASDFGGYLLGNYIFKTFII